MKLKNLLALCLCFVTIFTFITPAPASAQSVNPALQPCTPSQNPLAAATAEVPVSVTTQTAGDPALSIVSTVAPLTNLAFNIGGNRIKNHGLIPEGVDSHTFEPKPSDAVFLSTADIVFVNGLHLEDPTLKLAEANLKSGAEIVQLGRQTIAESEWIYDFSFPKENGNPNPHLWMNPFFALNYAKIIRDTLSKRDPANADFYKANYDELSTRITILDQAICDSIATIPLKQRKLLTYHDSFAYFAPRYNMKVIGAIQPADFTEPSAKEVASLIEQIKTEGVPAIFGSEVFPSKVLDQIAKETGIQYVDTLADDDLPNQTGDRLYHSYLQLMVNDVTTMTKALGGDPSPMKVVNAANIPGPDDAIETSAK